MKRSFDEMSSPQNAGWTSGQTQNHIRRALAGCLFAVETDAFFTKFMPVRKDVDIDAVLTTLKSAGHYNDEQKRWPKFELHDMRKKEADFYPKFIEVAVLVDKTVKESIQPAKAVSSSADASHDNRLACEWTNTHKSPLFSSHFPDAKLAPDIVSVQTPSLAQNRMKPDKTHWCDVVIPFEVKRGGGDAKTLNALLQLGMYVEELMREQPHRRFCFGVQIVGGIAGVWLFNRSFGLRCTFDIHAQPDLLIRVLLASSTLPRDKLGYDTSMTPIFLDMKDPYQSQWEVNMRNNDDKFEVFVLFRALSLTAGGVVCGRSTRVWLARKKDDDPHTGQIYVLKDAWNPRQEHSEGSLYEHLGKLDGLAQCDRWGQVTIDGRLDDTDRLICQSFTDLHPLGKALKLGSEKIEDSVSVDGNRPKDSAGQICKLQQQPEPRDHHRVLLATLGWPLCEFFNLRELLTVLHDAVGGLKNMCERSVYHRDVSIGNILINSYPTPQNVGVLIDLDHASKSPRSGPHDPQTGTIAFMSAEELTQTTVAVAEGEGPETETESQPVCLAPHELHDLESIFWALCHICMTRNGPGQWRKELSDGSLRASVAVCSVFEPLQIYAGSAKMNVIRYPRYCTSTICDNLAPYFQPLHDLIKKLQIFLKAQYFAEMRGKPLADLHTPFMEIFADAIKNLCDEPAFDQFDISSDHLSGDPWQAVSLDFGGKTFEIKRNVLIMMGQVKKRRTTEQKNWDSPIKQRTKIQKAREEEAAEAAESASPPRKKPRT